AIASGRPRGWAAASAPAARIVSRRSRRRSGRKAPGARRRSPRRSCRFSSWRPEAPPRPCRGGAVPRSRPSAPPLAPQRHVSCIGAEGLGLERSRFDVILGIETSCDETAAALVTGDGEILANVVASQAELHARFGGVVPEIASRRHLELVAPVLGE